MDEQYFIWMLDLVCDNKHFRKSACRRTLRQLHEIEFTYLLKMDANRAEDGVDLRYRFTYETGISMAINNKPCSVLEMMIALALRCEEQIMNDPEIGNRTGVWFFKMFENLGLLDADECSIDRIIDTFLNREYSPNGEGNLFIIHGHDIRNMEIWNQMMWYLNDYV